MSGVEGSPGTTTTTATAEDLGRVEREVEPVQPRPKQGPNFTTLVQHFPSGLSGSLTYVIAGKNTVRSCILLCDETMASSLGFAAFGGWPVSCEPDFVR